MIGLGERILAEAPFGSKNIYYANVSAAYGPYDNLTQAINEVKQLFIQDDDDIIPLGVTVAVKVNGKLVEYWNNESAEDFVVKNSGGDGTSNTIEVKTSDNSTIMYTNGVAIEEDSNTYLDAQFPSVGTGIFLVDDVNGNVYLHYKNGGWIKFNATKLTDTAQTTARIVNASVLSFK